MRRLQRAGALAPPSIGNFGPGLDVLGCAVDGAPDVVIAEVNGTDGRVCILESGHPELPTDPELHASAIAGSAVLREIRALGADCSRDIPGVGLRVRKGLPLAAGQGGSAASAVAGAVAVNALLGAPLGELALLRCALEAESRVAGRHLDNIAPALLGGLVLIRSLDPIEVVRLPTPGSLYIILAEPKQRLRTVEARAVLPERVDRAVAMHQAAQVASIVAALYAGDIELLGRSIDDRIAEPARAPLMPGFVAAKAAAIAAGALGVSISGAGPTSFAIAANADIAERVSEAMRSSYERAGIAATTWVTRPGPGSRTFDPDLPLPRAE